MEKQAIIEAMTAYITHLEEEKTTIKSTGNLRDYETQRRIKKIDLELSSLWNAVRELQRP